MAQHYRTFFATPGVKGLVITGIIARQSYSMIGIGLITMLVLQTGHYGLAGAVGGIFTVSNALLAPRVARFVDRRGQRLVLPWVTAFSVSMLLILITAASLRAPAPILFILAALAGTMPSMPAMIRAHWARIFRGSPQLHTAFSLDTVLAELAFIVGAPLSIALSSSLFAEAGPLAAVFLLVCGVTVFLLQCRTEHEATISCVNDNKSVFRTPGLSILIFTLLMMGIIAGTVDVAAVAFANEHSWPTAASLILAAYALGSMLSGLVFGGLRLPISIAKQFFLGGVITAITTVPLLFSPNVFILAVAGFVAGVSFSPTIIIALNLGSTIIPQSKITEGLAWMMTGIGLGVALGAALTGLVVDSYGANSGFSVAVVAGAIMMMGIVICWRRLCDAVAASDSLA